MFKRKANQRAGIVDSQCLFEKHGVSSGKITVDHISYRESYKSILVSFLIVADSMQHSFTTSVTFTASEAELLDNAFGKIAQELDDWLLINKEFNSLKKKLDGKVVFEYQANVSCSPHVGLS